ETALQKFHPAYSIADSLLATNPEDTSAISLRKDVYAAAMQKTADSLFDTAQRQTTRKQFAPAEVIAKKLTLEYPTNSDYKILWSRLLAFRHKVDTSKVMLYQVVEAEPKNLEAYDALADDELVTNNFKRSLTLADTGIALPVKGDRTYLVITKASAQDNLEDYYGGLTTLDTLVKNHPEITEAADMEKIIKGHILQKKADSLFNVAQKEAEKKNYIDAQPIVDTITKWFPNNTDYMIFNGRVYSWEGKYDTALAILHGVIKKDPHNLDAYDALTDADLWKKDFAGTVTDCDKILQDSIFIRYPSMLAHKKDTALMKLDTTKKDTTDLYKLIKNSAKKDTSKLGKDTAKVAKDTDARKYYSIFMLKRAHALFDYEHYRECVNTLDTMRKVDSTNKEANDLLTEAKIKMLKNTIQVGYLLNVFNNAPFGPWDYTWIQYTRNIDHCPVSAKITYGSIYGLPVGWRQGVQFEVGAYPSITRTTSADVTVAYSNNFAVFPQWQIAADIIQRLPLGFEASIGGIYMHFIDVVDSPATAPQDVWIFDPYIGYYIGENKWQLSYRPYFAYKAPSIYITHTAVLRHFFGNPETWVSLYGTYGTSPFVDYYFPSPIATKVEMIGVDYQTRLPHNWLIWPMVSYEYLDYYPPTNQFGNMFYFQIILTKRF
ncbi:MAG TPA: YaiO family outer membrane beta-barrel protein, partial [Bacteroidia bacterium]|nr:YaiO family outer membrane beta-barrel protein [Bacteroidia bacterium]